MKHRLSGVHVLIAEDEALVAMDLTDIVEFDGGCVIGPFATSQECHPAIDASRIDVAILDVRLQDGEVFGLADELRDRGVPIVFQSGHLDPNDIVTRYPTARCCAKPASPDRLVLDVASLVAKADRPL